MIKPLSYPRLGCPFHFGRLTAITCLSTLAFACDLGETSAGAESEGGSATVAGSSAMGGSLPQAGSGSGGTTNLAGGVTSFGIPTQVGTGTSTERYRKGDVKRDAKNYFFMANGWGPGFQSQSVSWLGTSFTVAQMQGVAGPMYQPASYPTMFCGVYSDSFSGSGTGECGLPRALDQISSIMTGWRWKPNGNAGQYNAAYDIWLSTSSAVSGHSSFLMVWLRDPPGQQPAGANRHPNITVAGVPGSWNIWSGNVGGKPCVSYVRAEGQDTLSLEFDVMAFVRDVSARAISLPGSHVLSVAVGFEIWAGPITNLVSEDFYVDVK